MRLLAVAAILAATLIATPALAQSGPGMSTPPTRSIGELSQLSPTHRYWEICLTGAGEEAVRACGRVIGARVSRLHTATAHYFRSVALTSMGRDERALRDLRRAYFSYVDLLFEEEDNALARYGRGLSLIRLGREAEGEEDITRARETSEGRAGEFFEISS
ncbi:hypothetical protein [Candidatus Viadribacter manganicus]|uniref:Tetratricopeptide repeat protein n=1 Tax=Candidatus Viadribacter manganicus TaxID=1759059 RepID=A0A1B1AHJ6_9PROT|nr:hypothetical protein [Candidatus Viadribacter manganicus]ANP46032.1 hypothetical protein ATE48_08920 [Candidatus Viadribacter manganicus]